MAYAFDTAGAIRRLQGAGLSSDAAQAIVETVAEFYESLATKADMAAVKADIAALDARMTAFESRVTTRIVTAQVATAALLFAALRLFGA